MRFYGFAARRYLIRKNLEIGREAAALEIGVGAGSTAAGIAGRVHEFWGVDVSEETVSMLQEAFAGAGVRVAACGDSGKRIGPEADADMSPDTGADADVNSRTTAASIKFICGDAAGDLNLGRKFDVIYSADTLEHVERPQGFFDFIGRHLAAGGTALVTFPNESAERHHGVTWFASEEELREMAGRAGLAIIALDEVRKTLPHRVIRAAFWDFPEAAVSAVPWVAVSITASSPAVLTSMRLGKNASKLPKLRDQQKISACPEGQRLAAESGRRRSFEETMSFAINRGGRLRRNVLALYAEAATRLAALFPLYRQGEVRGGIRNKILLLKLRVRGGPVLEPSPRIWNE